jgi:hypothetical protein
MGAQGVSTLSMAETTRSLRDETLLKESHRARWHNVVARATNRHAVGRKSSMHRHHGANIRHAFVLSRRQPPRAASETLGATQNPPCCARGGLTERVFSDENGPLTAPFDFCASRRRSEAQ